MRSMNVNYQLIRDLREGCRELASGPVPLADAVPRSLSDRGDFSVVMTEVRTAAGPACPRVRPGGGAATES